MRHLAATLALVGTVTLSAASSADEPCVAAPDAPERPLSVRWSAVQTWGAPILRPVDESPVSRARELLASAKLLDETAAADERTAFEITTRLPVLRASAEAARDKAQHATGEDREILSSRAEDLEADVVVSEAESASKRRAAGETRRLARDLRARAIRIVRDPASATACDPPYRFTPDGRKSYLLECFK